MASSNSSQPSSASTTTRLVHVENQLSGLTAQFSDFLIEQRVYRKSQEKSRDDLWRAFESQGKQTQEAIEKLSSRGQISWGMIATAITTILAVGASVAAVGHLLMESRIRQLEITDDAAAKLMQSELRVHEAEDKFTREMIKLHEDRFREMREDIKQRVMGHGS